MLGRPEVGERARSAPAESGKIFPKLGLLWEGGLQGHLWSSQWALREASGGLSGPCVLARLPLVPPFRRLLEQQADRLQCETSPRPTPATLPVAVWFGATERRLQHSQFEYTSDPNVTSAGPTKSFLRCWAKWLHGMCWRWGGCLCSSRAWRGCRASCGRCDSHANGRERDHVAQAGLGGFSKATHGSWSVLQRRTEDMGPWPEFGCGTDTKNPSDCGPKSPAA